MVSTRQMSTSLSSQGSPEDTQMLENARLNSRQPGSNLVSTSIATTSRNKISQDEIIDYPKMQQNILLLDLPIECVEIIFSYVGYKKVGQMRVISKLMNQVCGAVLNSAFSKLQTQMFNRFQAVKSKMPRRESARRNHPLACECDIIETCHMRLSLLQMTFGKHIERKHCCFFPGGILDEVYNVVQYIRSTPKLERPYRVTDELFDLSTMAMEYFKENIEKNLPEIGYFNKNFFDEPISKSKQNYSLKTISTISDSNATPPQSNMVLRKGIRKIKQGMKMYNNQLSVLRSELRNCKKKSSEQGKQIAEQQKLLAEQQKQTLEYANRLDENDKKNEEMSRKFSTLLQELNKCKTELQYWRSKSPATHVCNSCGHKIAPILASDDFEALVNQGIKLVDDDTDENDTNPSSLSDIGMMEEENEATTDAKIEFALPDEATTAKLLAVSSFKVVKRSHNSLASFQKSEPSTAGWNTMISADINSSSFDDTGTFTSSDMNINPSINKDLKPPTTSNFISEKVTFSMDNKNIVKNIPTINPSTFYPSSVSCTFSETNGCSSEKKRRVQKSSKRK